MPRIEVYSSPWCPFCWQARRLLASKGVDYVKIPIRMYLGIKLPTARYRHMVAATGGDGTIPQIFVDGRYLGTEETLDALDREGRLDDILAGRAPVPD